MKRRASHSGYSLIELLIATGVAVVSASVIFSIAHTGLLLFSKNSAINIAHQQARIAVLMMEQDLHSAISIPQLVDASRAPVAGSGPAAGISCQLFAAGPFKINSNQTAGNTTVAVAIPNGYVPKVGQRLIVPTHQIELNITGVSSASGGVRTLTLASGISADIVVSSGGTTYNVPCLITDRVSYVVANQELRYFGRANNNSYKVLSTDISSGTPFSTPTTPLGAPYNRFVAAINLSTSDVSLNNRGYKAANMFLNSLVPCRTTITTYQ